MSVLRGLAVFLISTVFTFATLTAITSYTLGDLIQKENLKTVIKSELTSSPNLIEQECENNCLNFTGELKQTCIQLCISEFTNQTEKAMNEVNKAIDEFYEKEFFNISMNDLVSVFKQFILFVVLSIISGALILIVSKDPLISLGKSLISVSIPLFVVGFLPSLFMVFSNIPIGNIFSNYLAQGFDQQTLFAIIFVVIGIALIITDYLIKRKKLTKEKKK